jgi:hypothetical protein
MSCFYFRTIVKRALELIAVTAQQGSDAAVQVARERVLLQFEQEICVTNTKRKSVKI